MDGFWELPQLVQFAIFGAVGGLAGALISRLVTGTAKRTTVGTVISVVCVMGAIALGNVVVSQQQEKIELETAMRGIEAHRLFAVLFKYHPQAESQMRTSLAQIFHRTPPDQIAQQASVMAAQIINTYVQQDILRASDASVAAMLSEDLTMETRLQPHPQACVDYYQGRPVSSPDLVSPADVAHISDLKADIIEAAFTHPSPPPAHPDMDAVVTQLVAGYHAKGYDPQDMAQLGRVDKLPPVQGCKLAIEFSDVLASMPAAQASTIFKSFLEIGGKG